MIGKTNKNLMVAIAAVLLVAGSVFAQTRPKVAVYVTGGNNAAENRALSANITNALVRSGRYTTIERTDVFLGQVEREMLTQRSGTVDDRQISRVGAQHGADFVCVAEILEAFGSHQLSARIINVVTAEVIASGVATGSLRTMDDLTSLSNSVTASILGNVGGGADANTFVDHRDNRRYRIKRIGDYTWFMQDLVNNSGTESFNPATLNGQFYRDNLQTRICPDAWRIPTNSEWRALRADASANDIREFTRTSSGGWWESSFNNFWDYGDGDFRTYNGAHGYYKIRCVRD